MHQTIDWFSWLAKTGLDPSLIYEYGMSFSRNELEEDDIAYFNHEFLQSMGISIAKHRLEILKLARKTKGSSNGSPPMSKLIFAIKKTKRTLLKYIQTLVHRDESALVLVQKSYGSRWKGTMLRRSKRLVTYKQATPTLLLTNGNHKSGSLRINSFSSPGRVQEIKWDTMFQNLKPT
ncbi:Sterile alpha motif/pointed domain-containing protein [Artemisia annua]|uniref:Sterile alpha motif/pointed domain-containing protein n=1 Tax=Artemisia annua TaxID=35608 RepID=A0A2U1QKF0_ARTAN|nr:Sterile alpha motif/pointed domain-containing protein [Artemisia annua]